MIRFELYENGELSRKVIDELWDQEVDMDDWDYLLFASNQYKGDFIDVDDAQRGNMQPKSYEVGRLLTGSCANGWYPVSNFRGRPGILGVAYHA